MWPVEAEPHKTSTSIRCRLSITRQATMNTKWKAKRTRCELCISHSNDTACCKYRSVLIVCTNTHVLMDRYIHISGSGSDLLRYEAASLAKWFWTFRRDLPPSSLRVQGLNSNRWGLRRSVPSKRRELLTQRRGDVIQKARDLPLLSRENLTTRTRAMFTCSTCCLSVAYRGGWGSNPPPRNFEVLTKSNRIANWAENV